MDVGRNVGTERSQSNRTPVATEGRLYCGIAFLEVRMHGRSQCVWHAVHPCHPALFGSCQYANPWYPGRNIAARMSPTTKYTAIMQSIDTIKYEAFFSGVTSVIGSSPV